MGHERHGYTNTRINVIGQSWDFEIHHEDGLDNSLPWVIAAHSVTVGVDAPLDQFPLFKKV